MQPKNDDMPNSFSSLTCAIVPEENEMPRILNKIAGKWIESKYTRKTNHAVHVKHILDG